MSLRGLLVLVALAAAAWALALAAPSPVRPALPLEAQEGQPAFPALGPALDTVARVRIEAAERAVTLIRASTHWEVHLAGDERPPERADGRRVADLLGALAGLDLAEAKTRLPERYGLIAVDDPQDGGRGTRITVYDLDDRVRADLILGTVRVPPAPGLPGEMFVRKPGAAQAWLARGGLSLPADPEDWRAPE